MKITFIGLGKMGTVMVERLLQAGYEVTVYNRTLSKMRPVVEQGALESISIEETVKKADVVMSSLLNDEAVLSVTDEIVKYLPPGKIHVGLSTILPDTAKALQKKHEACQSYYISATVLGVPKAAKEGKLTAFFAGEPSGCELIKPLLQTFAQKIVYLNNQIKAPSIMKICINYSLVTTIELIGELYTFAEKSGLDTELVQTQLHEIYSHPAFKLYIDKIHDRNFDEVNFDMIGGNKDISLFQEAFSRVGVSAELGNVVRSRFISALAQRMDLQDWSAISEIVRQQAGIK